MEFSTKQVAYLLYGADGAKETKRVQRLIDDGLPGEKTGRSVKYDAHQVLQWALKNMRDSDDGELSIEDQLRLKRIDDLEVKIAEREGRLVPKQDVVDVVANMLAFSKGHDQRQLISAPKELAKKIARTYNIKAKNLKSLEAAVRELMDESFEDKWSEMAKLIAEAE